ncbi:HSP20-like chaperones superfamily protein [Euphorbia peplus]|nr:HSP20-like chaperones superfamily protein [Euphorbia peplus]
MLPSSPKKEDWVRMRCLGKNVLCLSGSDTTRKLGPSIGRVNINEFEDSYMFRVGLPGVRNNKNDFSCQVEMDGKVEIKGMTAVGEEFVGKNGHRFKMLSKNLGAPGEFSLKFNLPGPVNLQQLRGRSMDGMLDAIVMKPRKDNNINVVDDIIMSDADPLC